MFIIVGGTGHVGSAVARTLIGEGQPTTVVTRSPDKGEAWRKRGAQVAVADVNDVDALRAVFRRGVRAFLLNPPGDPTSDSDSEERATVRCLLAALDGSGLEKAVALSTYGARPGAACGDLTVLYELEEGLRSQSIPAAVVRSAYLMSNWDPALEPACESGVLVSMLPRDLEIPMVAPKDLGQEVARLLREPAGSFAVHHAEGPQRYTPDDVAAAFTRSLGRDVDVQAIPRDRWVSSFRELGFSEQAARAYACMTGVTVDGEYEVPTQPLRGTVSIEDYVSELVSSSR